MKLGLLLFSTLCSVSSVYGQVDGSFWWETNNNNSTGSEPRENSGQILTTTGATPVTSTTITHAIVEGEVWCTCVTWYLCENNTIVTDGAGLIDIRSTAVVNVETCPLNEGDQKEICCGARPATPPPPPPTPTPIVIPTVWCECVLQNLCNNGVINSDGAGVFDIRFGTRNITINVEVCPIEGEICCGTPPVVSTTIPSSIGNNTANTTNIPIAPTGPAPHGGNKTTSSATTLYSINLLQIASIITPFIVTSHLL